MASLHSSAFTRPALLDRIDGGLLHRFLQPHRAYLAARGFTLTEEPEAEALAAILIDPGPDCPRTLLDALFCIGEMSLPGAVDALQETAERAGLPISDEETPVELALRVWMTDPEALMARHAERAMLKVRSFQYFSAVEDDEPPAPTDQTLTELERSLDIWFEAKGRGRGTRVHAYPRGSEIWFLVRRGDLYRREVALEAGERRTLGFRPEKYDVVVFNQLTNELGINGETPAIRDCYRKQFGFHLFGRENLEQQGGERPQQKAQGAPRPQPQDLLQPPRRTLPLPQRRGRLGSGVCRLRGVKVGERAQELNSPNCEPTGNQSRRTGRPG